MNVQLPVRDMYDNVDAWAAALQAALEEAFQAINTIPAGSIVARETVPNGWLYCDGTQGTPDLTADELPGLKWIMKK